MLETTGIQRAGTLAELIKARRTVRLFKSDPVPMELLVDLLNIAAWAPNHGAREPWRFIVYKEEARKALAAAMVATYSAEDKEKYGKAKWAYFTHVPLHLLVVMGEDPRQKQWDEDYAAVCAWIQTFQLAAWEENLGVVWKTNNFVYHPGFREAVGVQPGEKIVGLLHIGYPEQIPAPRPRTDAREFLTVHDKL
ncbi:nitroreductase family protein [Paenibacillus agricola]|uniref:Putative NAD(P)H nitroreductase n=1 Tax=Paenibacillus agricola TaxID=2716264 RepID=A0ABX0JC21_9BACL|nr:nitroreductase [Paenibacillus agricola]NHN32920.1 nitroreductase [Paenibacillus agricola]